MAFAPEVWTYRFYANDGGEAASTPLAAENTAITVDINGATFIDVHFRFGIRETGGTDGTLSAYRPQVSHNGGAFADLAVASTPARYFDSANLTHNTATTDRATNGLSNPGTGAFVAGVQSETNGVGHTLTANNFTEHVQALRLVAANMNHGDVLTMRVTLNTSPTGITNSVTPTINVINSSLPDTRPTQMLLGVGQ